ncbi:Bug family tripartite tricarboxylate transporter substrate binding protein [Advenella mimigardefordensis]|uniref:Putative Bug-like extracytoplasmic solute binding receptor, TTT family n=1 Tax=Advenella mimigardefordensis (strain DSM 17166 / LMG 22922 / DPN7) TaxID=1247726 RepID=W0P9N0_ADVMD|nr:tripartite tricarboxylate transporter substrate binding protein [Advenella mimigardefordensis]AHG62130.1 putative Bug-like extracytoplasmic solute binding receptor, TTT family [Advenella mimigardefordensis DPN7]
MKRIVSGALLFALSMAVHASDNTVDYPAKPVRIVVGFTPGGPTDVVGRAFANFVGKHTGKDLIVENKPGANSTIATRYVSQAKPDGYTLLGAATNHTMIPILYGDKVQFDAVKSFTPICTIAKSPTVLVVGPSVKAGTFAELLEQIKKEPGKFTAANSGVGSSVHFATALFEKIANIKVNHVPFNGSSASVNALMGSQVDMSFATLGSVLPQVGSGRLRILAVAAGTRLKSLPDVPTFEEQGIKGYAADAWYGFMAPAGTPDSTIKILEGYVKDYEANSDAQKVLATQGLEPDATCGADFAAQIKREVATYGELAKQIELAQ